MRCGSNVGERDALSQTVPLSVTGAEEITGLREWAKPRAVPAST